MTPVIDFAFYWLAAHHLARGVNPYQPQTVGDPIMFAPPWILPLLAPLGLMSFHTATFLWQGVCSISFGLAVIWLWELYSEGRSPLWAMALCVSFTPVVFGFVAGQIDALILLGVAGFLRYEDERPYLAGTFLFLCSLKPQIVFLIWLVLVWRAVFKRHWRSLASFATVFVSFNVAILLLRPHVFIEYSAMLQATQALFFDVATLGSLVRHFTGIRLLQYFPAVTSALWLLCSDGLRRADWNWRERAPELLLISLVAAPYAWYQDHLVLIPALFVMLVRVLRQPRHCLLLATVYFGLNVVGISELAVKNVPGYAWIPLVWLGLYAAIDTLFPIRFVSDKNLAPSSFLAGTDGMSL